jgi:hypothetical protein
VAEVGLLLTTWARQELPDKATQVVMERTHSALAAVAAVAVPGLRAAQCLAAPLLAQVAQDRLRQ